MALCGLLFSCLEMRARAFNCPAALLQQTLMYCQKYDLSTIVMPRAVTSVSDMRDVPSHSCCSVGVEENNIK